MKKRDLDDNLKLREKEAEAEGLNEKIEKLKKNLGDLKYETIRTEKGKLQREEETLTREVMYSLVNFKRFGLKNTTFLFKWNRIMKSSWWMYQLSTRVNTSDINIMLDR